MTTTPFNRDGGADATKSLMMALHLRVDLELMDGMNRTPPPLLGTD